MLDNRSCNSENNTNNTTECTKVFRGSKKATEAIIRFVSKATKEINACLDSTGPSVMIEVTSISSKNKRSVGITNSIIRI